MDSALGLPAEGRDDAMNALLASLEKFDGDPGSVVEDDPPLKPVMHAANGLFVAKACPPAKPSFPRSPNISALGVPDVVQK